VNNQNVIEHKIKALETFTGTNFNSFKIRAKYFYSYSIMHIESNGYFDVYTILQNYEHAKRHSQIMHEIYLFLALKYLKFLSRIRGNNFRMFRWKKSFNYFVGNTCDLAWVDDFLNEFYKWYNEEVMKNEKR
jgi:hypothetical protein